MLARVSVVMVNEYDQTDEGQTITIRNLAGGIYWLRAVVDSNNFLA